MPTDKKDFKVPLDMKLDQKVDIMKLDKQKVEVSFPTPDEVSSDTSVPLDKVECFSEDGRAGEISKVLVDNGMISCFKVPLDEVGPLDNKPLDIKSPDKQKAEYVPDEYLDGKWQDNMINSMPVDEKESMNIISSKVPKMPLKRLPLACRTFQHQSDQVPDFRYPGE